MMLPAVMVQAAPVCADPNVIVGDVDGSGKLDLLDVVIAEKFVLGVRELDSIQRAALDVNGDGMSDSADALLILQRLLDFITAFPQAAPAETQPSTAEPVTEPVSSAAPVEEQYCLEVAKRVNKEREACGLTPLLYSNTLAEMAQLRAKELVILPSHDRPDGRDCFSVFDDYGIRCSYVAENLACWANTPEAVMNLWMNSDGHRSNILDRGGTIFRRRMQ